MNGVILNSWQVSIRSTALQFYHFKIQHELQLTQRLSNISEFNFSYCDVP